MRIFIVLFVFFVAALPARADNIILINPKVSIQPGGVSGTIIKIRKESLRIQAANGDDFKVDLDEIDLNGRSRNLFEVGQSIFVEGVRTDDDEIRARRITVNETGRVFDRGRRIFIGDFIVK